MMSLAYATVHGGGKDTELRCMGRSWSATSSYQDLLAVATCKFDLRNNNDLVMTLGMAYGWAARVH